MNEPQQVMVSDLVSDAFASAYYFLVDIFETDDRNEIAPFAKLAAALRVLPAEAQAEVGVPVILNAFKTLTLDPTTQEGRNAALPFVDNIALAVGDAAQYIQVNMQRHRTQAQQRLLHPAHAAGMVA